MSFFESSSSTSSIVNSALRDDLKALTIFLLKQYESAWQENAALKLILEEYPMPDGSKGIPRWDEICADWLQAGRSRAHEKFAALYERIQHAQQESDLLELLKTTPPMGGIQ